MKKREFNFLAVFDDCRTMSQEDFFDKHSNVKPLNPRTPTVIGHSSQKANARDYSHLFAHDTPKQ